MMRMLPVELDFITKKRFFKWLLIAGCISILVTVMTYVDRLRPDAQLLYCEQHLSGACVKTKTLRVPRVYFGSGYWMRLGSLDINHLSNKNYKHTTLEVAYPSMQAWAEVPIYARYTTHKIVIELGIVTEPDNNRSVEIYHLGTPKPTKLKEKYHGLIQYLTEPSRWDQMLVSDEPLPRVFIMCAYREKNMDEQGLGCRVDSFTPWGLHLETSHKRILLPYWEDMYSKTQALIQSFVMVS